jgi:hypothetical protein
MKHSLFQYLDYRKFLDDLIKSKPEKGRGERKKLADALDCQMAFVTHVMNGDKDFNHEQGLKAAKHFNLNEAETEFFLDLISHNRAGTRELRTFFEKRLSERKNTQEQLKNRLNEHQNLRQEDQAQYYSHWLYGAIHMASTVPALANVTALMKHFNLPEKDLMPILEFLSTNGLIIMESGTIKPGKAHLFLDASSPLTNQNHTIWRVKALNDLKENYVDDLHYSLCFSASHKDWPVIREHLLAAINDCLKVIRPSKEEKLGMICIDLQGV